MPINQTRDLERRIEALENLMRQVRKDVEDLKRAVNALKAPQPKTPTAI